jgi:3-mercaptopyruvate sulfurtransferase SseA
MSKELIMKRALFVLMLFAFSLLAACGGGTATTGISSSTTVPTQLPGTAVQVTGGAYWVISPAQLYVYISPSVKDVFLLNVDAPPTLVIPKTDAYITPDTLAQNMNKLPVDKNYKIVVYCMAGIKSPAVAAALVAAGYTRVMELQGGTAAWQQQGYQVTAYTKPTVPATGTAAQTKTQPPAEAGDGME